MKVLLGHSGSDSSWKAFRETIERAAVADDEVTIAIYDDEGVEATPEEIEQEVQDELDDSKIDAELRRIEGHVGGRLVELGDGRSFDRLVIAGGDRSTLGKIQLGSVAEFVVLNSETPVTLIR